MREAIWNKTKIEGYFTFFEQKKVWICLLFSLSFFIIRFTGFSFALTYSLFFFRSPKCLFLCSLCYKIQQFYPLSFQSNLFMPPPQNWCPASRLPLRMRASSAGWLAGWRLAGRQASFAFNFFKKSFKKTTKKAESCQPQPCSYIFWFSTIPTASTCPHLPNSKTNTPARESAVLADFKWSVFKNGDSGGGGDDFVQYFIIYYFNNFFIRTHFTKNMGALLSTLGFNQPFFFTILGWVFGFESQWAWS